MITDLQVRDPDRACIPWWKTVPFLKDKESLSFGPGLTVLWGPNGSGKSTILTALGTMLFAKEAGRSVVTHEAALDLIGFRFSGSSSYADRLRNGLLPVHDGQSVTFFDPAHRIGLSGGGFNDNFFEEGLLNVMARESAGQGVMRRFGAAIGVLTGQRKPGPILWQWAWQQDVEAWRKRGSPPPERHEEQHIGCVEAIESLLVPSLPEGPPTVLLDEPDQSLQLVSQFQLWKQLARAGEHAQILVATHSPFALELPGATYVDMVPGYLEECRYAARALAVRFPPNAEADEALRARKKAEAAVQGKKA